MMPTDRNTQRRPPLAPIKDAALLNSIVDAISHLGHEDLQRHNAWDALDELSSRTIFDGVEPHPDGIFKRGTKQFEVVATVYVTLNYGGKGDTTSMSDSYPAKIEGTIKPNNKVNIDVISVDTSSFYQ